MIAATILGGPHDGDVIALSRLSNAILMHQLERIDWHAPPWEPLAELTPHVCTLVLADDGRPSIDDRGRYRYRW